MAPNLYENNCAQCHGATGEGGKGPPLNDQNRLGFFNDDYYYRCIYLGNTGEEHKGTMMPAWGVNKVLPQPVNDNINLLVHWVRMRQHYPSLPGITPSNLRFFVDPGGPPRGHYPVRPRARPR